MKFPPTFTWGASGSAYQMEGAWDADGKGLSIWDMFTRSGSHVWEGHTGRDACKHYELYRDDVALFQKIGLRAYRLSVSWPRVLPEGDGRICRKGLDFYDRLVDELLAAGIQPWVTLFHWDFPYALFLRGGWLNPESPEWFARYTAAVVKRLSDRVSHWVTQSDPQCFLGLGHGTGEHAPGLKLDFPELLLAAHHSLIAHGRAVQEIRTHSRSKSQVGWAPSTTVFYPASPAPEDLEAARVATLSVHPDSLWNNTWLGDPVAFGRYPEDGLRLHGDAVPKYTAAEMRIIQQPLDFLGCNIFQGVPVKADAEGHPVAVPFPPGHPQTLYLWKQTPDALYWAARFLGDHYKLPLVITENGITCSDFVNLDGRVHDASRIDFMTKYLIQLRRALADGIDVRGYFYWSAMDNFEWQDGYKHRFGLIYVDYTSQHRTLKDSALWYRDVIASNGGDLDKFISESDTPTPYLVKETMRFVQTRIGEQFNIRDIAAHLRCHPDFLSRKFKNHAGLELSLYIRRMRIDHARELLKDPKNSIDDAAEQSGFTDRIHFAKVFRRLTGQTPGQYKRQFRALDDRPATPPPLPRPVEHRSAS
jgi:beta-glucosidase